MTASNTGASGTVVDLQATLQRVADDARSFVRARRSPDRVPAFSFAEHALVPTELNALTTGLELWRMLDLPTAGSDVDAAVEALQSYQNPRTGLVVDPTWAGRTPRSESRRLSDGDTFFTMTTVRCLAGYDATLPHPIRYLAETSADDLPAQIDPSVSCHDPLAIGDLAPLVRHNLQLGVAGASSQWQTLASMVLDRQDADTGLWPRDRVSQPYTPSINRTFHYLRSTWNLDGTPATHAERMIDTCLAAAGDPHYYSWEHGLACNDLDLALVLYTARSVTSHRADEVAEWASMTLPEILNVQKPDGGFSFRRRTSMLDHGGISMTPGFPEGDLWGTLMYLGTIKMMVELAENSQTAPWSFAAVHPVPTGGPVLRGN